MKYVLDTNICIYFLKGVHQKLVEKFKVKSPDDLKIPSIVVAELFYGSEKSKNKSTSYKIIEAFLVPFEIIQFGVEDAYVYGKVRADLAKAGKIIGPNDLIIAAMTLSRQFTLVTNNEKEFKRIKSIKIENWV